MINRQIALFMQPSYIDATNSAGQGMVPGSEYFDDPDRMARFTRAAGAPMEVGFVTSRIHHRASTGLTPPINREPAVEELYRLRREIEERIALLHRIRQARFPSGGDQRYARTLARSIARRQALVRRLAPGAGLEDDSGSGPFRDAGGRSG